jgi:hypothetical protein
MYFFPHQHDLSNQYSSKAQGTKDLPITTKFAAFFAFLLSNSAKTSKFLLFAFGVSSTLIASTPFAI